MTASLAHDCQMAPRGFEGALPHSYLHSLSSDFGQTVARRADLFLDAMSHLHEQVSTFVLRYCHLDLQLMEVRSAPCSHLSCDNAEPLFYLRDLANDPDQFHANPLTRDGFWAGSPFMQDRLEAGFVPCCIGAVRLSHQALTPGTFLLV